MAIYNNPFDSYQLFFYSGAAASYPVVIQVYQAGVMVGRIAFYPVLVAVTPTPSHPSPLDPAPAPVNGVINPLGTDIPAIYFPITRLEAILSTLREEKPLYLFLDTTSHVGMLATSEAEPVGEQEGV